MGADCSDGRRISQDVPSSSTEPFSAMNTGGTEKVLSRVGFDEFQQKWDKFGRDDFIEDMCEREHDDRDRMLDTNKQGKHDFVGSSPSPIWGNAWQHRDKLFTSVRTGCKSCTQDPVHAVSG